MTDTQHTNPEHFDPDLIEYSDQDVEYMLMLGRAFDVFVTLLHAGLIFAVATILVMGLTQCGAP